MDYWTISEDKNADLLCGAKKKLTKKMRFLIFLVCNEKFIGIYCKAKALM